MSNLYLKEVTCPICSKKFKTPKIKQAGVKLIRRDEDFCGYYETYNPTFYGVYVCPNCGYSAFEGDFLQINEMQKTIAKNRIMPKWKPRTFAEERSIDEAILIHQLCLLTYNLIGQKKSDIAKVCLRLAWFYRMNENEERERHFLTFALDNYKRAYDEEHLEENPDNQILIYYLIGEISRRLDNFKESIYWFHEALKLPHMKNKRKIEIQTRDQIILVKKQAEKQKKEATE
ncbi:MULTISPECIES: DUF2225 domain-containing protein [unclassified Fusibacter]|uniref:DUF2225 domain-containing protein n=1 Tax=unclassified Fusibacter TaxID=2624464 RepID=UPI001012780A|nr:DUF2225 domain-containing protein [Fusibacter sp. A1]MCK8059627.1 DUF2225 domain-containing protein [Fusibacter sp. A2]NPE21428.1 DUF2225 domain-containing protein [Fusibacter sp. A1]RXV61840.1 DUF2225 domain-containing protein [Fusibacter sp. A1]